MYSVPVYLHQGTKRPSMCSLQVTKNMPISCFLMNLNTVCSTGMCTGVHVYRCITVVVRQVHIRYTCNPNWVKSQKCCYSYRTCARYTVHHSFTNNFCTGMRVLGPGSWILGVAHTSVHMYCKHR